MDREKSFEEIVDEYLVATGRPPLKRRGWKSAQELFSSEVKGDSGRTPEENRLLDLATMRGYHPLDDRRPEKFGVKKSDLLAKDRF